MKKYIITLFVITLGVMEITAQDLHVLPKEVQIKVAQMAAPEEYRAEAEVYGYNPKGEFILLKQGANDLICLAPDPRQKSMLYTYAYSKRLEPFMARGRELTKEKRSYQEKNEIREAEVKAGKLEMPQDPTTLYVYWGKVEKLNSETGDIQDALRRYVVYMPYATAESTGLSDKPALPGMPWLMEAGTYKAHIMINPANLSHQHKK